MNWRNGMLFLGATLALNWLLHLWLSLPVPSAVQQPPVAGAAAVDEEFHGEPAADETEWKRELRTQLASPVTIDLRGAPLRDGFEQLRKACGVGIRFSASVTGRLELPVMLQLKGVEGRLALKWLTRLGGMHANNSEPGAVIVCGRNEFTGGKLATLQTPWQLPAADIKDLLENKILPDEFADKARTSIDEQLGKLVVYNSPEAIESCARIVRALHDGWDSEVIRLTAPGTEAWRPALQRTLRTPVSFEFENAALLDALQAIQAQAKFNLAVAGALNPKLKTTTVKLKARQAPLGEALDALAEATGIVWYPADRAICFGVMGDSGGNDLRIYNFAPLLEKLNAELKKDPRNTAGNWARTTADIANMLKCRVRPDLWDPALGTSIEERFGRIMIVQRPEVFNEIDRLLEALRTGTDEIRIPGMKFPVKSAEKPAEQK